MTTRVIVADGEPLFRDGLAQLLATQPDMLVVGEAADTVEAVEQAWHERPDVVLLALDLPTAGGQETARRIRHISPDIKVIMLVPPSADGDHRGIEDDVNGVIHSSARATQIFERIRTLHDASAQPAVPAAPEVASVDAAAAWEHLTPREREVLALVACAWSNHQIEDALGIHNRTVKQHVRRILRKLHARNRVQAAVFAYRASNAPQKGADEP
jgi:DNA-binding NarL/FixJ family response regulator